MKRILCLIAVCGIFVMSSSQVLADSTNEAKASNNPQVVAYYQDGTHGITGESATHIGADLVMRSGDSKNFQQWFCGNSEEPLNLNECDHSVWKWVGDNPNCDNIGNNWDFIADARSSWGDYLEPGNYCVHTNDSNAH